MRALRIGLGLVLLTLGCSSESRHAPVAPRPKSSELPAAEREARTRYERSSITLRGRVTTPAGAGLKSASVSAHGLRARSDDTGSFTLDGLPRKNGWVEIEATGHRKLVVPVQLVASETERERDLGRQRLEAEDPSVVSFLFGGDVAFGRRFLDPTESTPRDRLPPDDDGAMIRCSDPGPGTRRALDLISPIFRTAGFSVVNLETPVITEPRTPNDEKEFAFFTLPQSLAALHELGVRYVSLGNNHVYDYLEAGMADTLRFVEAEGLAHSGAGMNAEQAFRAHRETLAGKTYALFSMTTVSGSQNPTSYLAEDRKGGAADLRDSARVRTAIARERAAGALPIAQLHTGKEYTFEPSAYAVERMRLAAESGAALVIGHHPHVAQGFAEYHGVLTAQSLGNFAFDQDRLETMFGTLAEISLRGESVVHATVFPIYLEDYRPHALVGDAAMRLIRRIGEPRQPENVVVYPYGGRGHVVHAGATKPNASEHETSVELDLARGSAIVDLRDMLPPGASLASVRSDVPLQIELGEDILGFGEFEDEDVDDDFLEIQRWDTEADSLFACIAAPRRGVGALCSTRAAGDDQDSVAPFRNRVRAIGDATDQPNKNLTLLGHVRGDNAGAIAIVVRYYASEGAMVFGEERPVTHAAGTYGWERFEANLAMPAETVSGPTAPAANARALRLFLRHSPPSSGKALASFDDLAVVSWRPQSVSSRPLESAVVKTPNPIDYLRCRSTETTHARITLTFRELAPR